MLLLRVSPLPSFASIAQTQEGRMFLWLPVFLGLGIGAYFSLANEPSLQSVMALAAGVFIVAIILMVWRRQVVVAVIAIMLALGFSAAKLRTELVRAPVIGKLSGSHLVEGRLERIVQLPKGARNYILSDIAVQGLATDRLPHRLRLRSRLKAVAPLPIGARVKVRAVLRTPPGPVRPDGFDFARKAWFMRLGAVGFTLSPVTIVALPEAPTWRQKIEALRQLVDAKIKRVLPGTGGDIVSALLLGEKKRLAEPVLEAIRTAGLAHMLAISGMHMGLVAGTLYWLLRALLAISPYLALRYDIRKPAAFAAICTALFYYFMSGMGIATLRAFIMISIMFTAIILGRAGISLRNVALAALLILLIMPESLLDVSFQMSFSAVLALVAAYEWLAQRRRDKDMNNRARPAGHSGAMAMIFRGAYKTAWSILLTTTIAGVAVLPFAIYHFHHVSTYSLIGNLLAMPILTMWVMPFGLISVLAMPVDLQALPLMLMGWGTEQILWVAQTVAKLAQARVNTGSISFAGLILLTIGGLWLCLWRSWLRLPGLALIGIGILIAREHAVPSVLVERDGKNIVLIDEQQTIWVSHPRRGRYSVKKWRQAYAAVQGTRRNKKWREPVKERPQTARLSAKVPEQRLSGKSKGQIAVGTSTNWQCDQHGCTASTRNFRIAFSTHPASLREDCLHADILVATYPLSRHKSACSRPKAIIDIKNMKHKGAHALYIVDGRLRTVSSADRRGNRPWARHP